MKKIISIVIAFIIAIGCCFTAFAATTIVETKFTAEDVDFDLYEGGWTTIEVDDNDELAEVLSDLEFYLPSSFVKDEKTEDTDENVIISFTDVETGRKITISKVETDKSIEELMKELIDAGKQDKLTKIEVNGMVGYSLMTEEDSLQVILQVEDVIIQFEFTDADDEEYQKWIENMVKSIKLTEEDTSEK